MKSTFKYYFLVVTLTSLMGCSHEGSVAVRTRALASLQSAGLLRVDLSCVKSMQLKQNITFGWPISGEMILSLAADVVYTARKIAHARIAEGRDVVLHDDGKFALVKDYGASGYIFTENGAYKYVEPPYSGYATTRGCSSEESDSALTLVHLEGRAFYVQSGAIGGQIGAVYDGQTRQSLSGSTKKFPNCVWTNSAQQALKARQIEAEITAIGERAIHIDLDTHKNPYIEAVLLFGEEKEKAMAEFANNFSLVLDGVRANYFNVVKDALYSKDRPKTAPEFPAIVQSLDQGDCAQSTSIRGEIDKLKALLKKCALLYELNQSTCNRLNPNY